MIGRLWSISAIFVLRTSYANDKSHWLNNGISIGSYIRVMLFYATFNNISVISWWSVLLVEETGVPGEIHRHVASHWHTLSHNTVTSVLLHELTTLVLISSWKSRYNAIATTTVPIGPWNEIITGKHSMWWSWCNG